MQTLWQDLRYALRVLSKSKGFTAVAIITLAVAIGANAVVFSVMNALILRPPLHVPNIENLYGLQHGDEASSYQSYPDYLDVRDRNKTFTGIAAYNADEAGITTGDQSSTAWLEEVSCNYFDVLDIRPYLGRFLHSSDEQGPNSAPYIVLSYSYWHTHFQNDPHVIGRTVQLDKHPFTIIGVAQPGFHGTLVFFNPDIFMPIINAAQVNADTDGLSNRGKRWIFMTLGRLKPGVTTAQATADLNAIGQYLQTTYPKEDEKRTFALVRPSLYGDYLGKPVKAFMGALMLLAGMILLAACANLGSLFAARAADRSKEVALRLALGASRSRILRQLFTEAAVLAIAGGAVGLWCSVALLGGMSAWQPFSRFPIQMAVNPDANVYTVAIVLTIASGILFGVVPVRQVMRTDPYGIVKSGSLVKPGRRFTARDLMLGLQIAICAVLVTSSLVAVRGLVKSQQTSDYGFDPENTMVADTDLHMGGYAEDAVPAMQKRMLDSIAAIRGVESVGLTSQTMLVAGGYNNARIFTDDKTDFRSTNSATTAYVFSVSPGYLEASRTKLLTGRVIDWHDDKDAPKVAVINVEFARKTFGTADGAVGKFFKRKDGSRTRVIGIVADGKYNSLAEDQQTAMFVPMLQSPTTATSMIVRSSNPRVAQALRREFHNMDAALPVFIDTWKKEMDTALFPARMAATALGIMGAMGGVLAATGIFGMAAYAVSKRLRELGIRMALGAQRKEVLKAALGRAVRLLAIGSGVGLLLGILASRVLAAVVYQATPRDPLVLGGVVLAMALLGLAATWIPAQRAMSVDPAVLLREE
ncbi:MAG TPA: ABC transporter permease [Candidatus Acidoferrum sp.]|jgi:predicted permease|nr:ABC transporter permease [Candidatus Acidoferrum sp.]